MKKRFISICAVLALCAMLSACQKKESIPQTDPGTQIDPVTQTDEYVSSVSETTLNETPPSIEETVPEKTEEEKRYERLCDMLEEYIQYNTVWIEELNHSMAGDEAYSYLENAFAEFGDFKDSKKQLEKLSEAKKENRYQELCQRMNMFGMDEIPELEKAFAELGDYKDSKKHLETLAEVKKESHYDSLCALLEQYHTHASVYHTELGTYLVDDDFYDYLEKAFLELQDYKDSPKKLEELVESRYHKLLGYLDEIASAGFASTNKATLWANFMFSSDASDSADWRYLYDGFSDIGKHIDTTDILNHFTVIKDKLLTISDSYTDKLGNIIESTQEPEYFLGNDRMPSNIDWSGLFGTNCKVAAIERDEQQRISRIKFKENRSNLIVLIMTPKYDQNNNIVSMVCETNSKTWENVYTYNSEQQLIAAYVCFYRNDGFDDFSYSSSTYTLTYDPNGNVTSVNQNSCNDIGRTYTDLITYTYDQSGNLLQKTIYDAESGTVLENFEYKYDSQGRLVNEFYSTIYINAPVHPIKYTYTTFDALGRPLTATVEYSDCQPLHTETYTYGDVYFYLP